MRVYLMGVCGTAMSHVALLLKEAGHSVCGSDTKFFPPIADLLKAQAIETWEGYNPQRLKALNPDIVLIGNVISRGNAEVEYLLQARSIPFTSFPAFLREKILLRRPTYVVTGTHGKTTTTSLLAYLLRENNLNPGYLIGGLPLNFSHGAALGDVNSPFIIEGDEYDTAFFDKRSKFFHYWPNVLLINNLEFDHGDIFGSFREIQRAFSQLTRLVPSDGCIFYNGDDSRVKKLLPCPWTQTASVGFGLKNTWRILNFTENNEGSRFDLAHGGKLFQPAIQYPLRGQFNARNVAMAVVAALFASNNGEQVFNFKSLKKFLGVQRRQCMRWNSSHLKIFEDFAHHPTAIEQMLASLKKTYPDHALVACFEPACNTSASHHFEKKALDAFDRADEVLFAPIKQTLFSDRFVPDLKKMDVIKVTQQLSNQGCRVQRFETLDQLQAFLNQYHPQKPTVLCFLSNGPLSQVVQNYIEALKNQKGA